MTGMEAISGDPARRSSGLVPCAVIKDKMQFSLRYTFISANTDKKVRRYSLLMNNPSYLQSPQLD